MKQIIYLISILLFAVACGSREEDLSVIAGETARQYYNLLLDDKYEDFVAGMHGGDSLPAGYHEQMVANVKMFVKQQDDKHQGMKAFEHISTKVDTIMTSTDTTIVATTLLQVTFGDKQKENISVPMVRQGELWFMR